MRAEISKPSWKTAPLQSLCSLISSGGTPSRKYSDYFTQKGNLWVKSKELLDRSIYTTEETITDDAMANSSAKFYPPNTILMAMYGANVGKLGVLRRKATVNQAICAMVVDRSEADFRYVYYALLQTRGELVGKAFGAAQQNLNQDLIRNFVIPLPPLPVQRKIANILATHDDLIENNLRRIGILEELAQLLYREWFVRFRFPGYEEVQLADSSLGKIPEGWEVVPLKNILECVRRSTKAGEHLASRRYLPIDCLPRKSLSVLRAKSWRKAKSSLILFEQGDILFGAMRPYFHKVVVAPFPGVTRTTCFVLRPQLPEYRSYAILTAFQEQTVEYASAHMQGATIPYAVWDGSLAEMEVLLPPRPLLSSFSEIVEPMIQRIAVEFEMNRTLRRTRDLLLPMLVSGELDVSSLDIDTEVLDT